MEGPAAAREMVLALNGADGSERIQKQLLAIPGRELGMVILDVSQVRSVESGTLGAVLLLRQALEEEGCRLGLRGCSEPWLSALQLLRLDRLVCMDR